LLQIISPRKISRNALERSVWLQRRQSLRDGAIAFTRAQPVDLSVKIARHSSERDGKQKRAGKNTQAHWFRAAGRVKVRNGLMFRPHVGLKFSPYYALTMPCKPMD
jgi:hypothetical protein